MNSRLPDIDDVQNVIRNAARAELLTRFNNVDYSLKHDGSIVTEADLAMDKRLKQELSTRWPEVSFLSEEMPPAEQDALLQDQTRPLWCLDPLDGTSNYAAGIPYYCVSLALLVEGQPVLGVIYDPVRDESFSAIRGQGAYLNGTRLSPQPSGVPLKRAIALVDTKRLSMDIRRRLLDKAPYRSQRNFGSAALEWSWVAAGRGHVYLHGGHQIWDLSAGTLILEEAGGHSMTLEGEPVFQPAMGSRSVVASTDGELFSEWCDWLASVQIWLKKTGA